MISQKLSVYIPHVFPNITKDRIVDVFYKQSIGQVERVDYVPKKGKDGKEYFMAFIHMSKWFDNDSVANLQDRIISKTENARIVYDDPWFWNLYENVNPRSASELKMEEQIASLNKLVNQQKDRMDELDAFTQYLEDELNQALAKIAFLQDNTSVHTSSPVQDMSYDTPLHAPPLKRQMSMMPEDVSADIAQEFQSYGSLGSRDGKMTLSELETQFASSPPS